MKARLLVLLTLLTAAAYAQKKPELKISDMTMPSAPGLILADKAPASIERPANPKALGLSLINLWQGGAIDVTPYWLTNKPELTFEKYIRNRFPLLQTLNVSGATYRTDTSTQLSAGLRMQVFRLYYNKKIQQLIDKANEIKELLAKENPDDIDTIAVKRKNAELQELLNVERCRGLVIVELAGAYAGGGKGNSFSEFSATRSGVWANVRWAPGNFPLDFVALGRYSRDEAARRDLVDYGLSVSYQRSHFDLAVEYVNRRDLLADRNYERLALVGNYMINENFYAVASFGKNFDKVQDIIAILGIKVALSRERISL